MNVVLVLVMRGRVKLCAPIVLAILTIAGCTGDTPPTAESVALGPSGGRFEAAGLVIDVPAGAVDRQVLISITTDRSTPYGYSVDGLVYRFEPAGLHFATPISVTFPTGMLGESVFWTTDGDDGRFARLDTTIDQRRATARAAHFSVGFVGVAKAPQADAEAADAAGGVTCTVQERDPTDPCKQVATVEQNVGFWLDYVLTNPMDPDRENGLATNSHGILRWYNKTVPQQIFTATDATHTLYRGFTDPTNPSDYGTGHRSGSTLTFSMNAERGAQTGPGCPSAVPLVAVQCSGTTTLLPGPPPVVDASVRAAPPASR